MKLTIEFDSYQQLQDVLTESFTLRQHLGVIEKNKLKELFKELEKTPQSPGCSLLISFIKLIRERFKKDGEFRQYIKDNHNVVCMNSWDGEGDCLGLVESKKLAEIYIH